MTKKVYVVGLGPGGVEQMTRRAQETLAACDVIAGYNVYIDLIKDDYKDKEFLSTGMRKEVERCKLAIEEALKGKTVAMVSSGDAGVYGMAGIMYQIAAEFPELEVEVIPGITAACSGAAVLGAPLISDFTLISLSDLLTPWEKIEKRLDLASQADFVICLYNPSSFKRHDYLQKACDIMLKNQRADVPAGIVRNIGREGEEYEIMTLAELRDAQVDMFSTVIIGNSQTEVINNKMVTPRGYKI
ncbi:MAG: precorrin-3B C(17)-methyltransferase [Acidaminococcaceae bacterium]|jgi:precorrin-3B C17-methyltransferase|nr:precorrin-3B C(17)-methyltransferase [Acidaminococcaceae bacterium]MBP8743341.1 precorrin-3B C(17)-methyltransferase [Acidaminococcaceae bacterium]